MKRLLLSTAILGAATVPALAQEQPIFREAPEALEVRASDFMGMRVYATEAAVEGTEFEGIQEGWEDVGEINDIIMDRDGEVQAVLVDVGGFLGIGERTVAVSMDALRFVSDSATAEEADDFFLVMNATREALEAAPEYRDVEAEGLGAQQAATETEQAIEGGAADVAAAGTAVVEGTEAAGEEVVAETGQAAEAVENAAEETGEEVADAGQEVADETADAGEEVSEEVAQVGMTDAEEDAAEVADANQDAMEETAEETAQASAEAADEAADQAEMTAEATTETEMAAEETAAAATAEEGELTTADTQEEVVVSNVPADAEATAEEPADMASAEAGTEVTEAEQTSAEMATREPVVREGFALAGAEDLSADRLDGAPVFDANDERVGEIGEIILSADGQQVEQLVIDVGGFLGLGEKPVALELASVDILRQEGGEEIRVYVSQTEEELKAMDRYEPVN